MLCKNPEVHKDVVWFAQSLQSRPTMHCSFLLRLRSVRLTNDGLSWSQHTVTIDKGHLVNMQ